MAASQTALRLPNWLSPATPWGRMNLQAWLNSSMATALVLLHPMPWLAFVAVFALAALSVWLHGRQWAWPFALFGIFGWVGELWISSLGGVWQFSHPTRTALDGGLFGIPFYMAPAWAIVGAFAIAVAGLVEPPRSGAMTR